MGGYSVNLVAKLGQGSFGVVYKGKDDKTGRAVAIKQMKIEEEEVGRKLNQIRVMTFTSGSRLRGPPLSLTPRFADPSIQFKSSTMNFRALNLKFWLKSFRKFK